MTCDVVAAIDAAVDETCACLCGRPITPTSPSAYFASEVCSVRWRRARGEQVDWTSHPFDMPGYFSDLPTCHLHIEAVIDWTQFAEFFRRAAQALGPAARRFAKVANALVAAGLIPPPAAAEWHQQVIAARKARNVGPRRPPRAAKRIDPPSGFRSDARGRPAYRPRRV